MRRHRLIERFLTDVFDIPWDQVHEEAERLEHWMSPMVEERMLRAIGDAKTCPHGHPIFEGEREEGVPLADVEEGARVRVLRFENEAEDLLHYLKDTGLTPGLEGTLATRGRRGDRGRATGASHPVTRGGRDGVGRGRPIAAAAHRPAGPARARARALRPVSAGVSDQADGLRRAAERAADFRRTLGERPVAPPVDVDELRAKLGGPLPDEGADPRTVVDELVAAAEPALVATAGPRYFGFVVGGALDSATEADILATGWDQMAFNAVSSPAAAAAEEVVADWIRDLLGLPADASFGITTGAQGANTVALAAARHRVLAEAGWDVEADGLTGAPPVTRAGRRGAARDDRPIAAAARHGGQLGRADRCGRQRRNGPDALAAALEHDGDRPTIVCAQAGNVNTGACDDLAR